MVSIIIVTYNSEKFIEKCIKSIKGKTKDIEYEIIIVDNNSSDRTVKIIYEKFPEIRLIRNKKNRGFASANNTAIKRANGEFIFFLNPDTILENNAVKILHDFLLKEKNAGVVGAKLVYFDNSLQLSCRTFPNFINVFFGRKSVFRILFPNNPITKKYMLTNLDYKEIQEIDWLMGAAMMVRKDLLEEVGLFDEDYFLFVEDTDLCYRIKKKGYRNFYNPFAIVKHYHGGSVEHKFNISQMHHNFGMYKFFKKHYGKNAFTHFLLYIAILIRLLSVFIFDNILFLFSRINKGIIRKFS